MLTRRTLISSFAAALAAPARAQEEARPLRLALVVRRAGDDYYVSCREGALLAAAEVNGSQLTFLAPPEEEAARQAALIDSFVEQRYDAILVDAIPSDVVIASCVSAIRAGLRVIAFGSMLPPDARHLQLQTPDVSVAAGSLLQVMAAALGKSGELALLSSAPERADHLDFVKALQREWQKPDFEELALVTTVFAGGNVQTAYAETLAIVQAYPDLRGIIATDSSGLMGAVRAVRDLGRGQSVKLTGVGLPSRLAASLRAGVVPGFVTWSPIDVGYAAARIALSLLRNEEAIIANAPLRAGRLGELTVDRTGVSKVAELVTIDATNIDKYADAF